MQTGTVVLVICLTVLGGMAIPGLLYLAVRRGGRIREAEIFKRAANVIGSPWQREDADLEELSRRVEPLRPKDE